MQDALRHRIEAALDQQVRPTLSAHHGDVEVLGLEDGILKIRLLGQCGNCPSATLTTEQLIQGELTATIPEISQVVLVTQVSEDLLEQARAMLRHPQNP